MMITGLSRSSQKYWRGSGKISIRGSMTFVEKTKTACKSIVVCRTFSNNITIFVGKWKLYCLCVNGHFRGGETFVTGVEIHQKVHSSPEQRIESCLYFGIISNPPPPKAATFVIVTEK